MSRLPYHSLLGLLTVLATIWLLNWIEDRESARLTSLAQARQAQAIERGAVLYDLHCSECHGSNGEGLGEMGSALNEEHFFRERLTEVGWASTLEDYIIATTAVGRVAATRPLYVGDGIAAVMSPWAEAYGGPLRDDQIRDLAAFVLNWEGTALGEVTLEPLPAVLTATDDPQAITRGEQAFLEIGCAECHTIAGLSDAEVGPPLNDIGAVAADRTPELSAELYLRQAVLIPNAYLVEGYDQLPANQTCGGILSEAQLVDLIAFLLAQQ